MRRGKERIDICTLVCRAIMELVVAVAIVFMFWFLLLNVILFIEWLNEIPTAEAFISDCIRIGTTYV